MRKWLIPVLIAPLLFLGAGCSKGSDVKAPQFEDYVLEYWRYDDPPEALDEIIEEFRKVHPNVTVNVRTIRADVYEKELLAALAEDRGPDMFTIPNVWMHGWKNKLEPMAKEVALPTRVVNENKQVVTVNQRYDLLTVRQLIERYVEAVPDDVVMLGPTTDPKVRPENVIYGLPFSFDTLALFVNDDLLKNAGIEKPAATWRDFQEHVRQLTVLDDDGGIEQAGAAIGLSSNVRHSTELLTALMLQNGAEMADASGFARFDRKTKETQENPLTPGTQALIFYQSFGRKGSSTFTYDASMPDSLDAFISGSTTYYFGLPNDANIIRERAPRLNFSIAPMPQVDTSDKSNIARYPVEVVSAASNLKGVAWRFLNFAADAENVGSFLEATDRPTALRSLIATQLTNPRIEAFANQVLTGKTWYRGTDWYKTEQILEKLIETYPTVQKPEYQPLVADAVNQVNLTIR